MVEIMTGKEIQPTCKICVMLSPKPNKITAQSINSYFETKEVWIKKDKALLLVREKV